MIEIKKVTDINHAQAICREYNVVWQPDYHVIATMERDNVLQCSVFSYAEDRGEILVIAGFNDDINLLDGLCRAILNIMDINGVKEVYLSKKYDKLAEKVGLSEKHISNIERGLNFPALDSFFKLCQVLNLSLEDFGLKIDFKSNKYKENLLNKVYYADENKLKAYDEILNSLDKILNY